MEFPAMYESRRQYLERGGDGVIRDVGIFDVLLPAFQRGEVKIEPTDIFVCSYPRSGTNWVSSLVTAIKFHGDQEKLLKYTVDKNFMEPLLGLTPEQKIKKLNATPMECRIFCSHLYPEQLPPAVFQQNCKVIYVMRNPKDVVVSFFHFHRAAKILGQIKDWPFSRFLQYFMLGNVAVGSWFEHVKKWWKYRDNKNILFTKYEDIVKHHEAYSRKLAKFMSMNLTDDEVQDIVDQTEFKATRKFADKIQEAHFTHMSQSTEGQAALTADEIINNDISHFIRKGKVGDWKNHFTVAENESFDKLYQINMADSELNGLDFDFE